MDSSALSVMSAGTNIFGGTKALGNATHTGGGTIGSGIYLAGQKHRVTPSIQEGGQSAVVAPLVSRTNGAARVAHGECFEYRVAGVSCDP